MQIDNYITGDFWVCKFLSKNWLSSTVPAYGWAMWAIA